MPKDSCIPYRISSAVSITHRTATSRCVMAMALLAVSTPVAQALSVDAARENCRMSVGRPIVQTCMRASGGMANLEACREKARPAVMACMKSALNSANGRANVAVAIPTEAAPKAAGVAGAAPAAFVAPPRTITDITAILDSEKPDLKTIRNFRKRPTPIRPARNRVRTSRSSISTAPTRGPNSAVWLTPSPTPARPSKPVAARFRST